MDSNKLYSLFHWLDYSFFSLNPEKYIILNNSLIILQNDNHFKKVFFWGVIQGIDADYYIAFGYKEDAILDRIYVYSDDCQNWKLLPLPQREHLVLTELCKRPFQGDPGLVLEVVDEMVEFEIDEESIKENVLNSANQRDLNAVENTLEHAKIPDNSADQTGDILIPTDPTKSPEGVTDTLDAKQSQIDVKKASQLIHEEMEALNQITSGELKEEDRLAATIQIISEETSVVPRGGLFKQTDGVTVHSRAFEGLTLEDADELCAFQHYRLPQSEWNTNLLTRVDYNYAMDFLDTIDKDIPQDIWNAQLVEGDRVILLSNLTWPGFIFFHHLETPDFGYLYIGSGQRNLDTPFMTQVNEPVVKEEPSEGAETSASTKGSKTSKTSKSSKRSSEQPEVTNEEEQLLPLPIAQEDPLETQEMEES